MDPIVVMIACIFVAWIFFSASWVKFQSPTRMKAIIDNYKILPCKSSSLFVAFIAMMEFMVALCVLIPASRQLAAMIGGGFFLLYGMAIGINILRGRVDIDCGCSTPSKKKNISVSLIWRNIILTAIAIIAALPLSSRPLQWVDYVVVLLSIASFILIYQIIERLMDNHQQLVNLKHR